VQIQYISNSFLIVKTDDAKIVCDPWVGHANHGGWHSFPEYKKNDLIDLIKDSTHVYISHLHSDHLDLDFLKFSLLYKKKFIIKKFRSPNLENRLNSIGVTELIGIDDFKNFQLSKNTNIAIIPQITSNSAGVENLINYSLDTSIIFNSNGKTFFNQVDNPLSLNDFHRLQNFISTEYGDLDIACFTCGAASEYPQCFRGIDRSEEKKLIIEKSLLKLKKIIEITKPKYTFIAGGAYFIPGKFSILNQYIAQPSFEEIKSVICKKTNLINLEGGASIDFSVDSQHVKINPKNIQHLTVDINHSIQIHSNDLYDFQLNSFDITEDILVKFEKAKNNYIQKIKEFEIKIERVIIFKIYENIQVDSNLNILSNFELELKLLPSKNIMDEKRFLVIHIDKNAFMGCLNKRLIWNQIISGSICIFDRFPNTYEPDLLFSLNFLVS